MITLTDSQVAVLQRMLTAVLIGEPYRISDVEQCLSWLQSDRTTISCPFEQSMGKTLAEEIIAALRGAEQQ